MINIVAFILPIYLSIASRLFGGGFFSAPRWLRSIVFSLPYPIIFHPIVFHSIFIGAALSFIFAYLGKNIGHDNFWNMGTSPNSTNLNWLGVFLVKIGLVPDTLFFCSAGMAIIGIIMALGTFNPLVMIFHALGMPLAYYVGMRTKWGNAAAEFLSGFLDGLILSAFLLS